MRCAIRTGSDGVVTLPDELAEALGRPEEAEVIAVGRELVVRPTPRPPDQEAIQARLAAMEAYRASLPPDIGFTEEEWAALREATREADRRENEQIVADFPDDDVPA
jgi:hypothetical protein